MRVGIKNNHLTNISAKNYHNQLMCVKIIVCYICVDFRDTVQNYLHQIFSVGKHM